MSRRRVKLEAYNTVTIRDWWVGFERDVAQQQWLVAFKVHFESPDIGVDHSGTLTVTIKDGDQAIETYQQEANLRGDSDRQVTLALSSLAVPFSKVSSSLFVLSESIAVRIHNLIELCID